MTLDREHTVAMGEADAPASPTQVRVEERCPGNPHPFDTITLQPQVTLQMGVAAVGAMRDVAMAGGTMADANGSLASVYLHHAIRDWTFVEQNEQKDLVPVPITTANIDRLLPYANGGLEVAEACEVLYGEEIARPLVKRTRISSPPTKMPERTSPNSDTGEPPEPSPPSSPKSSAGKRSEVPVP